MTSLEKTVSSLRSQSNGFNAGIAVTLGSGLGGFSDRIDTEIEVSYADVEGMVSSSVDGHEGEFVFGTVNGVEIVAMNGRIHYYETGDMTPVVKPIRILSRLGVDKMLLTNAAGGVNKSYEPGDVMIIEDHINNMGDNPLIGGHNESYGDRFPDMSEPYDSDLISVIEEVSEDNPLRSHRGVYMANSGPSYETPAEVRMARKMGADAVGMSTVPECIVANQEGMEVAGLSTITNHAAGVTDEPLSHSEVKSTAKKIREPMNNFVSDIINSI